MIRKIAKYALRIVLGMVVALALLPALLYIPAIQDFVVGKAESYVSQNTPFRLSVDRIRLSFPLKLTIDRVLVGRGSADTLLGCDRLQANVALWPLLRKEVVVTKFALQEASFNYADTVSQLELHAQIGRLQLRARKVDLNRQEADIPQIELTDGKVRLSLGEAPPDTAKKSTASIAWRFIVGQLNLHNIDFRMETRPRISQLEAHLATGSITDAEVSLGTQEVRVDRVTLQKGYYAYLSEPSATLPSPPASIQERPAADSTSESALWSVRVNHIRLQDNSGRYGRLNAPTKPGLDLQRIAVSGLNLTADSLYNRGTEIRGDISHLSLSEQCGLSIQNLSGRFGMDSARIFVADLLVQTPHSRISADLQAGSSIMKLAPESPVELRLEAEVDPQEAFMVVPALGKQLQKALAHKSVTLKSDLSGTLGALDTENELTIPNHVKMTLNGRIGSATVPDRINGQVRLEGAFSRMDFVRELLPDTTLRNRLAIPNHIALDGRITMQNGTFAPVAAIAVDSGTLSLKGRFTPRLKQYDATLVCDSFPADRFLPADSLGRVTLELTARGEGFDFLHARTSAEIALQIKQFEYRSVRYDNIALDASLQQQRLSGRLTSRNEALQLALTFGGELTDSLQEVYLRGKIDSCHLERMHLTKEQIGGRLALNLTASASARKTYRLNLSLDQIELWNKREKNTIRPTSVSLLAAADRSEAVLRSGDMQLDFSAPTSTDTLSARLTNAIALFREQLRSASVDMDTIGERLPPFRLRVQAGEENILNNYLELKDIHFQSLAVEVSHPEHAPLATQVTVDNLTTGGGAIRIDTLSFGLHQRHKELDYLLRTITRPAHPDDAAMIALWGTIRQNHMTLECQQQNGAGKEGFRFGLQATAADSTIRVSMYPENPLLGFERWHVNPDNHISYHIGKDLHADFVLTREGHKVALQTSGGAEEGPLHLDIQGIDIGKTLALFPSAPRIDGMLDTRLELQQQDSTRTIFNGNLAVTGLMYDRQRIGDLGASFDYTFGKQTGQQLQTTLKLDSAEILRVEGRYTDTLATGPLDLKIAIPGLPLAAANALLPHGSAKLSGALKGEATLRGSFAKPRIDGTLAFDKTSVAVTMIGTAFTLSSDAIRIDHNRMHFTNYQILAPNRQPLTIDGLANFSDFAAIALNLTVKASDFQVVNVQKNKRSAVYGKAFMDLNTSVKGVLDNLVIRGNAGLLGGTEISYVMQDSPLEEVKQKNQDMVTFVSFRDTSALQKIDSIRPLTANGMDIQLSVNVNNSARLGVDLSEDGNNRVQLEGGGDLSYTVNPLGDSRLSGKYVVSGGFVRYTPPLISEKVFKITPGSFVEWTGNMLDPTFNLTAVESLRTMVTTDDEGNSHPVTFDISINMKNTLSTLAVTFDLSTPGDLTLQSQILSLTPEQRATQAMSLLIYNTYTGPGTSTSKSTVNPLNSFIAKELNQWAQNSLKGVDVSFGIDSYNQSGAAGTQRTDYSYRVSKNLFNNRVRAVVGGKFSTATGSSSTQNLGENLVDDISLEYMVTKRDNMFIKLFRHTDYESILEGEIIETGVGFVIRKKMLKITDLFRFMKNKTEERPKKTAQADNP